MPIYNLTRRKGPLIHAIYPIMKNQDFTSSDAAKIVGREGRGVGSTLGALAMQGAVKRVNGNKRCHYAGMYGPTIWRFTSEFKKWYENRYL